MRHFLTYAIALLCLLSNLEAKIIESNHIAGWRPEVEAFLKEHENVWIISDLDGVVFQGASSYGSDSWYHYELAQSLSQGISVDDFIDSIFDQYLALQEKITLTSIEPDFIPYLNKLQCNYTVFGLTARACEQAERTLYWLNELGLDFSRTAPFSDPLSLANKRRFGSQGGVLFMGSALSKGRCIEFLIEKLASQPKAIIFFDDRLDHISSVSSACETLHLPVLSIHYAPLAVANQQAFAIDLSEFQREYFEHTGTLLTNQESNIILNKEN